MPKKAEARKVLDGRAEVFSYTRNPSVFFIRVFIARERRYKTMKIDNAVCLEDAETKALDTYLSLSQDKEKEVFREPRLSGSVKTSSATTSVRKVLITDAVAMFLREQEERVEGKMIKPLTLRKVASTLNLHFIPYCERTGLIYTRDIRLGSLDRYPVLVAVESRNTIRAHLTQIGSFLNNLCRKRLLDPYEASQLKSIIPSVKIGQEDLSANPPFRKDDWDIFKKTLRDWVKEAETEERPDARKIYGRRKFWCLVMFLRQTGMRPAEALSLKWKDIETVDVGRFSETKYKAEVEKRDEELFQIEQEGIVDVLWEGENDETLGRETRYITHIRVLHSKTRAVREVSSNSAGTLSRLMRFQEERVAYLNKKYGRKLTRDDDTRIFDSPLSGEWKPQVYSSYTQLWSQVLSLCVGLKGPLLSEKPYTKYSLRSSRAMELLELGVELAVAASQMGHSPGMLLSTYARLPRREQAVKQAAHIEFGKKKEDARVVNLEDI